MDYSLTQGSGKFEVKLQAFSLGNDLVVSIYNSAAHIGAVAIGEFDFEHNRASVSVVTRLGHKDDAIAQKAAYLISKSTRKPVCVIAGVHLDNITVDEIDQLIENVTLLIDKFIKNLI
jgi:gallate decarboxylase subunit D